jgi:hypothetical protein
LRWRWIWKIHLPAVVWGFLVQYFIWACPLTTWENYFRELGGEAGYEGGFIEYYLTGVSLSGLRAAISSIFKHRARRFQFARLLLHFSPKTGFILNLRSFNLNLKGRLFASKYLGLFISIFLLFRENSKSLPPPVLTRRRDRVFRSFFAVARASRCFFPVRAGEKARRLKFSGVKSS